MFKKKRVFRTYIFEDGFTFVTYSIKRAKKFAKNAHGIIVAIED